MALLALVFFFSCFNARADTLTTNNCSTDGSINFITGDACASGSHTQSTVNVFDSQPAGNGNTGDFSNMTQTGNNAHIKNWTYNHTGLTPELWFQHTQDSFAIELAITQALAGAGLKVDGYTSRWKVNNTRTNTIGGNCNVAKTNNQCVDPLTITIEAKDSNGTVIHTDTFDYGSMNTLNVNPGAPDPHWFEQTVLSWVGSGQLTPGTDIASVGISIAGYDAGYWAGNYGPRVKELEGSLIISQDICSINPLHSTNCSGYATAYANQQYNNNCSADPLYDSGCPGYSTAHHNQQCSADPLYDSSCSGYATAYYNQQCSADALYDSGCPGYQNALAQQQYNQSCTADPLYDSGCPGYSTAYFNQQCGISALYDSQCPGYAQAYYDQQCSADSLYDTGCPGYATAYFDQQCTADALYDAKCPGYAAAYLTQQCSLDTLYDSQCPGYAQAFFTQQCTISGLYDTTCPNYDTAYFDNQCTIDSTYNPACPGYAVAIVIEDAIPDMEDGTEDTAEEIAEDITEIISVESITEVAITGDAVVDSVINEEPTIAVIEVIEESTPETTEVITIEEEIVPLELAVESAFDDTPVIETFNTFIDTGPIIAPLASNAQIEQQAELVELEVLVESIEAEVEFEMTQLDANIQEPVLEAEVESVAQIIEEENTETDTTIEVAVAEEKENVDKDDPRGEEKEQENEATNETNESNEDVESSEKTEEDTTEEVVEEEIKEEVVEEEIKEEVVEETVVVEAKPKKLIKMTAKQKADAKAKKMREIIKDKLTSLAKDMGEATSLKEQAAIQAKIQALVNFVPGFNGYGGQIQAAGDFYGNDSIYTATNVPENNRGLLNGLASQLLHEQLVDLQYK